MVYTRVFAGCSGNSGARRTTARWVVKKDFGASMGFQCSHGFYIEARCHVYMCSIGG